MDEVRDSGAQVISPVKVQEIKIADSVKSKVRNARNSYIVVRVPGTDS